MYTDGKGTKLSTTFAAGGYSGKATFIRAVQLTRGSLGASATLVKVNNRWVLKVLANGRPVAASQTVNLGGNIVVKVTRAQNGRPVEVVITTPYLSIRVAQRARYYSPNVVDTRYGEWLDVYLTVLRPLPLPVGGLLGEEHPLPPAVLLQSPALMPSTDANA
ncbi:hypothetical protein D9Q98_004582 [Chlorella vulgaris]|uniref:Uncharacterized protein n=1 Tax=Chlorella vulgaris TaxID=3077 RepID=A0A9D4TPW2_CHLVU|nr:hypothetical protein D9Q98_004582 [Chlorella vulgaris]